MKHSVRVFALLLAIGAVLVGASASAQAASAPIQLKTLPISGANNFVLAFANGEVASAAVIYVANHHAKKEHGKAVYPTAKVLKADVAKLSKSVARKLNLGSVPSVANGKTGVYYIGGSTAKQIRVVTFYKVDGETAELSVSAVNKKLKVKGVNLWLFAQADFEVTENGVAGGAYTQANTNTGAAGWTAAYLTASQLVSYVKAQQLSDGTPLSADAPPTSGKPKLGTLYLGATTTSLFSGTEYSPYSKPGWDLEVTCTRTLTGKAQFTAEAVQT